LKILLDVKVIISDIVDSRQPNKESGCQLIPRMRMMIKQFARKENSGKGCDGSHLDFELYLTGIVTPLLSIQDNILTLAGWSAYNNG
jgi:hypothetical protein